jgi:hypothetical protein
MLAGKVGEMESFAKVKAQSDFYDDVHFRRVNNLATTLCGLKVTGSPAAGDVSCVQCRRFAAGEF